MEYYITVAPCGPCTVYIQFGQIRQQKWFSKPDFLYCGCLQRRARSRNILLTHTVHSMLVVTLSFNPKVPGTQGKQPDPNTI